MNSGYALAVRLAILSMHFVTNSASCLYFNLRGVKIQEMSVLVSYRRSEKKKILSVWQTLGIFVCLFVCFSPEMKIMIYDPYCNLKTVVMKCRC